MPIPLYGEAMPWNEKGWDGVGDMVNAEVYKIISNTEVHSLPLVPSRGRGNISIRRFIPGKTPGSPDALRVINGFHGPPVLINARPRKLIQV